MDMKKIKMVAARLRRAAESAADMYGYPGNLDGMCDIVSAALVIALRSAGCRCRLVGNDHHAFVVVGDYIVDLTATQFDKHSKTYILHKNTPQKQYYHQIFPRYKPQYTWYTVGSRAWKNRKDMIRFMLEVYHGAQP